MPTVKQILVKYLRENGYDGLCLAGGPCEESCGCGMDDLFPCSSPGDDCRPAYMGHNKEGDRIYTTRKPKGK